MTITMPVPAFLRRLVAAIVLLCLAGPAAAATITYAWSLEHGDHAISGTFSGLIDNRAGQSVTGAEITASTLGGVGVLDLAAADKNRDFAVVDGVITAGHLKFRKLGDGTPLSPELSLELRWKKGVLDKFEVRSDDGTKPGRIRFDFADAGAVFTMGPRPAPQPLVPEPIAPVPLPAGLPLLLAGLGTLALMGHRRARP